MTSRPLISVIIVTYNNADEIAACVDAALDQEAATHDLEIVVVDNASSDGTRDVLEQFGDKLRLIPLDTNRGFAAGVNAGVGAASGDVVLLLNPDCTMDPGCVEALWQHLARSPGVGAAAGLLRYPDGRPQLFARRELELRTVVLALTRLGAFVDRGLLHGRGLARRRYEREFATMKELPLAVDCPAGACVAVWRKLLPRQPLDPALPLVFNDADLYRRLRARGYRVEVVPAAQAAHGYGTTLRRVPRDRMRAEFVVSLRRYAASEWGPFRMALLWLILFLDGATTIAATPLAGRSRRQLWRHGRGTLGGLRLPGGSAPWLSTFPSRGAGAKACVRPLRALPRNAACQLGRRLRRRLFAARLRFAAWLAGAPLELSIDRTADLARDITFEIRRGSRVRVVIGPLVRMQRGVILRLGGTLEVGARADVRYGVTLNVKGPLVLHGRNTLGRGSMVHADAGVTFQWGAVIAEYTSVIDSNHGFDGSLVHVLDQPVTAAPIHLGAGTFVGAHCSVLPGIVIGPGSAVGANSVVSRSLPAGVVAVGTPAAPTRPVASGWAAECSNYEPTARRQ